MKQQINNLEIDQQLKWNNDSEMEQQLNMNVQQSKSSTQHTYHYKGQ